MTFERMGLGRAESAVRLRRRLIAVSSPGLRYKLSAGSLSARASIIMCARLTALSCPLTADNGQLTMTMSRRNVLKLGGLAALAPRRRPGETPMTRFQPPHAPDRRTESMPCWAICPRRRPIGGTKQRRRARRLCPGDVAARPQRAGAGAGISGAAAGDPCGRAPAVLFNHSHGGGYTIGKQEFVDGRSYLQPIPTRRP